MVITEENLITLAQPLGGNIKHFQTIHFSNTEFSILEISVIEHNVNVFVDGVFDTKSTYTCFAVIGFLSNGQRMYSPIALLTHYCFFDMSDVLRVETEETEDGMSHVYVFRRDQHEDEEDETLAISWSFHTGKKDITEDTPLPNNVVSFKPKSGTT